MMRRILMIEDDNAIVYSLSELLREEGFETAKAASLKEALEAEVGDICLILRKRLVILRMDKNKAAPCNRM